jgi:hypothetical protein
MAVQQFWQSTDDWTKPSPALRTAISALDPPRLQPELQLRFPPPSQHVIWRTRFSLFGQLTATVVPGAMSTDEPPRVPVSEETPLLRDAHPAQADQPNGQEPLTEERPTRELILILGSIWLGVFLAALGMSFDTVCHWCWGSAD